MISQNPSEIDLALPMLSSGEFKKIFSALAGLAQ